MKTLIVVCTLFIVFQGTINLWIKDDLVPQINHYRQVLKEKL